MHCYDIGQPVAREVCRSHMGGADNVVKHTKRVLNESSRPTSGGSERGSRPGSGGSRPGSGASRGCVIPARTSMECLPPEDPIW